MSANRTLIFFGRCRRHCEFRLNLPYGDEYVGSVVGPENLRLGCQQMAETIRGQLRCRARASWCITVGACRRSGRIAAPGRVNGARCDWNFNLSPTGHLLDPMLNLSTRGTALISARVDDR